MRAAGSGRIVNIGSMGGRVTFPVGGYYHATKYAVEAITDALRFEAAPFGIRATVIEPGLIRTGFGATAARTMAASGSAPDLRWASGRRGRADDHGVRLRGPGSRTRRRRQSRRARSDCPPCRARYTITPAAKTIIHSRRLLGSGIFDTYLRLQFRSTK